MKNTKAQIAIAFICILLGFMITVQVKSVRKNTAVNNQTMQRAEELQTELKNEKERGDSLYKQVLQYEKDLQEYQKNASDSSDQAKGLLKQLQNAQIQSGMTDVEGPGVTVTLTDSQDKSGDVDAALFVIHDTDILRVVNELFGAGAEAISVNDERMIATSEIRCVGNVVTINGNRYAPPYVIKAIGSSDTLEAGLNIRDGVVDELKHYKIGVTIKKSDKISIGRYNGAFNPKYAVPVQKGGD